MIQVKKILMPTDFSPFAAHALKYAASFAKEYEAKLYILHAYQRGLRADCAGVFLAAARA